VCRWARGAPRSRRLSRPALQFSFRARAWYHAHIGPPTSHVPARDGHDWARCYARSAVPELPDLAILADALQAVMVGRPIDGLTISEPLVVRGTPAEASALTGQRVVAVSRRGKFLTFQLERDRIVLNPMLTGRVGLGVAGAKPLRDTAVVLRMGSRVPAPAGHAAPVAAWTVGASWLPSDDRPLDLRYRDPTRMGKLYLLPTGVVRTMPGWSEQGPDADDPALDQAMWRARTVRHSGELKNLLKNQAFVAGIGNGYSDEILWAARLAPFRRRASLVPEEVDSLYVAMHDVLAWAIGELRSRVPPHFEIEVRDFLRVHRKGGKPCPRCGTTISEVSPGGFVTSFCRSCQR
jgi:formamidopyrimidine-DNA glycosylase